MQMRQLLKTYQTKLTNLSASNKSLLQLRAYKQADLDLHELNFLNSEASIKIVEKLLLKKTVSLCMVDDPRSEHNNTISKRIQQIGNRAKFIQNERGSEDLYLAYPFVQGKLKNGFPIRCPLFFIPVTLSNVKNQWHRRPGHEFQLGIGDCKCFEVEEIRRLRSRKFEARNRTISSPDHLKSWKGSGKILTLSKTVFGKSVVRLSCVLPNIEEILLHL